ncbi:hypothetical protein [Mangrovimonas aestuarii]|uniref:hypothetical protein n=1 Tax=Mangrovimonas aestuarii TaxID=3018443 RepID=UPI0023793638|nr:hypothetical protein [Mangrovimonas aestuarii]
MDKSKLLTALVLVFCLLFVLFQVNDNEGLAESTRGLIVPIITAFYFLNAKYKSKFFSAFLVLFSISELLYLFDDYILYTVDYLLGNGLNIAAYICFIVAILKTLDIAYILKNCRLQLSVLIVLNSYIVYVLWDIQYSIRDFGSIGYEYIVEMIYNIVTLLLLSIALLNYLYKDDKRSLLLFLGALSLLFSEVIQIAYYYIAERELLNMSYSTLLILAFYLFYIQSTIKEEEVPSLS